VQGWDFERGCVLVEMTHDSVRGDALRRLSSLSGWKWVIGMYGALIEGRDLRQLGRRPELTHLASLTVRDSEVGHFGASALAGSEHARRLIVLNLEYCTLGDSAVLELATSPNLTRLMTFTAWNNRIGAEGVIALARSDTLQSLRRLDLSRNPIGDDGAKALASCTGLPSLRVLALASCGLTDRAASALARSARLRSLSFLDLTDNRIRRAASELRERFGDRVRL
jgi:hypothetical protein